MFTLNCRGKLLIINEPIIMGIINITPDSFYEGHISKSIAGITEMASQMLAEGAAILDIGGQSTRPGSRRISAREECDRVIPAIEAIVKNSPSAIISIDTYHSEVARLAVNAGASIVNDISSGTLDNSMIATVAGLNVPYIAMHMKGRPESMQQNPAYDNVTREVIDFFIQKTEECRKAGIKDIIIDPGFGFGKTITHNFQLLREMEAFQVFNYPVLAGLSRKSTIWKTLKITPAEALNGTTCLNSIAIMKGANILRVHDVKEARELIQLWKAIHG